MMTCGELRALRLASGLTQTQFSKEMGVSQGTICRMERGGLRIDRRTEIAAVSVLKPYVLQIRALLEWLDRQ